MDLGQYVDQLREQLEIAAVAGGEEARALADRLTAALDSAVRLTLFEVLSAAAAEITRELAPGSVELRLRGREPDFVVTPPQPETVDEPERPDASPSADPGVEGGMTRINLRLGDQLKARIELAAERDGMSINSWLVRVASLATERGANPHPDRPSRGGDRYTGWAR